MLPYSHCSCFPHLELAGSTGPVKLTSAARRALCMEAVCASSDSVQFKMSLQRPHNFIVFKSINRISEGKFPSSGGKPARQAQTQDSFFQMQTAQGLKSCRIKVRTSATKQKDKNEHRCSSVPDYDLIRAFLLKLPSQSEQSACASVSVFSDILPLPEAPPPSGETQLLLDGRLCARRR